MKKNRVKNFKQIASAALLLLLAHSICLAQSQPEVFADLERTVSEEMRETKTPGAAVVIIRDNRVVFTKGFGTANVETNAPVTEDTLFHIGSLTKMMTAAAVVNSANERQIDLNAPVGRYFNNLNSKIARLTLDQLLSQTAGLRDVAGENGMQDEKALAEFARSLNENNLLFEPGRYFSYSNAGYALAGAILERISGKTYAAAMRERIFAPLSMTQTTFQPAMAMTYPLAVGHTIDKDGKPQIVRPFAVNTSLAPAGYAYSSVNDFASFIISILGKGKFNNKTVFSEKTVSALLTPRVDIPVNVFTNGKYGYGWFLQDFRGYPVAEHAGTQIGFSSEVKIVPEQHFAVIIFANRDGARLNKTIGKAFDLFLPVKKEVEKKSSVPLEMTAEEMQSYTGTYSNRWSMDIFVRDGKLFLRRFGAELPITKIGKSRFSVIPAPNAAAQEFTIDTDASGKVEAVRMFLWTFKKQ